MERFNETVNKLVKAWDNGEMTDFAYQVSVIYSSMEYRWVSNVMDEFKKRINE